MTGRTPQILLLSAYDATSHRYWREWLATALTEFHWTSLALPDRHFYWRIRSNALTFYARHKDVLTRRYDLIIATSMTDLATLRGFVPALSACPAIVYFHENQFAYPINSGEEKHRSNIVNARLNTILTALTANVLVFNSRYNKDSFAEGVLQFIRTMPDGMDRGLIERCLSKSLVMPVPIVSTDRPPPAENRVREIVWNHRWEYDKQPHLFFEVLYRLASDGVAFRLHLMGQSFRNVPDCFTEARERLAPQIATWGFQPRESYLRTLQRADLVVSTALHDFQGLGMLEAIDCGCVPVAPDRMAYPEYVPADLLYDSGNEVESLTARLRALLHDPLPPAPDVERYSDSTLVPEYRQLIARTIAAQGHSR